MKTHYHFSLPVFLLAFCISIVSCDREEKPTPPNDDIVGHIGNPQFNLQFTNHESVDVDLYVKTPDGSIINWAIPNGQGGQLDVDCHCSACPNGPNENIYWDEGTAPSGYYEFWVEYFNSCDLSNEPADYTLRVIQNGRIVNTYTGTLSINNARSRVYSFTK